MPKQYILASMLAVSVFFGATLINGDCQALLPPAQYPAVKTVNQLAGHATWLCERCIITQERHLLPMADKAANEHIF